MNTVNKQHKHSTQNISNITHRGWEASQTHREDEAVPKEHWVGEHEC